jgi:glycosyltransferase involved in cell wall biosynthesis
MRIAFVSDLQGAVWGGSEELWSLTARRLAESGASVSACVTRRPESVSELRTLEATGCRMHWIDRPSLIQRLARKVSLDWDRTWSWLRVERPDLVVINLPVNVVEPGAAGMCTTMGIAYVLVVHNAAESQWPSDAVLASLRPVYERARKCFFVSKANWQVTERQLATRLPQAEVIRNPFNVCPDAAPGWPDMASGCSLACVGSLNPKHKGQDLVLDVLAQSKWRDREVKVTFYGGGPNAAGLRRLAGDYHKLSNVSFAGHVANIEELWAKNHALFMPSRYEGLPLAVVEAMLCQRPCIVTAVAGNSEVIEDNVTGFLAAAPTLAHVDEALERAWNRRTEWQQIGEKARTAIREKVPADPVGEFIQTLRRYLIRSESHAAKART